MVGRQASLMTLSDAHEQVVECAHVALAVEQRRLLAGELQFVAQAGASLRVGCEFAHGAAVVTQVVGDQFVEAHRVEQAGRHA